MVLTLEKKLVGKRVFWGTVLSLFALVSPAHGEDARDESLPMAEVLFPQLESVLSAAMSESPRMVQSNLARLERLETALATRSNMFPSVGGMLQFNFQEDRTANRPEAVSTEKLYYSLQAVQPLFHWGTLQARTRIDRITAEVTGNNMAEAYRLLALEIRRDFLQLVILKQSADNARFDRDRARQQVGEAQAKIESGESPASLAEPTRNALDVAELSLERSEYALRSAVQRFQRLTGQDDFREEMIPDGIPRIGGAGAGVARSLRMNYVEKGEVESSIRFINSQLQIAMQKRREHIFRMALRPRVDLVAGTTQDERSYTLDVSSKDSIASLFIGMRVTWNIFDSFGARHQLRSAMYRTRQLELQAKDLREDLITALENAETELGFAQRSLGFSERSHGLTVRGVASAESLVVSGRGSPADVDAAKSRERVARIAVFQARAAYLSAAANLLSLVNRDPFANSAADKIMNP